MPGINGRYVATGDFLQRSQEFPWMGTSGGLDIERHISREEGPFPGTIQTYRVLRMPRSMQDLKLPIAQAENLAINQ
jgi:hypothetical protein